MSKLFCIIVSHSSDWTVHKLSCNLPPAYAPNFSLYCSKTRVGLQ